MEHLIERVVTTMPAFVDRIIIVDDASTDATVDRVRSCMATEGDRIVLLEHESNQGVGGAIVTGYRHARDLGMAITAVMAVTLC